MSFEALRCLKPDHKKPVDEMKPQEVLNELLYLESGHADDTAKNGVKVGLSSELRARLVNLRRYITGCIRSSQLAFVDEDMYGD